MRLCSTQRDWKMSRYRGRGCCRYRSRNPNHARWRYCGEVSVWNRYVQTEEVRSCNKNNKIMFKDVLRARVNSSLIFEYLHFLFVCYLVEWFGCACYCCLLHMFVRYKCEAYRADPTLARAHSGSGGSSSSSSTHNNNSRVHEVYNLGEYLKLKIFLSVVLV